MLVSSAKWSSDGDIALIRPAERRDLAQRDLQVPAIVGSAPRRELPLRSPVNAIGSEQTKNFGFYPLVCVFAEDNRQAREPSRKFLFSCFCAIP